MRGYFQSLAMAWTLTIMAAVPVCAADRLSVDYRKAETGSDRGLEYQYTFTVRNQATGQAVSDAKFKIATDMPSMPGAHHMAHVEGAPTGNPGEYRATIDFDMAGEWSLILRFTKPHRDQVVLSDFVAGYICKAPTSAKEGGHQGHQHMNHQHMGHGTKHQ